MAPAALSSEDDGSFHDAFEPDSFKCDMRCLSVAASASELLFDDLSEKTKLLRIASREADQYKKRCLALAAELASVKKRSRSAAKIDSPAPSDATLEAPKKKRSPPEAARAEKHVAQHVDQVPNEEQPKQPLPSKATAPKAIQDSDDEVPAPAAVPPPAPTKAKAFEDLSSILCAYKDKNRPASEKVIPGSTDLPFNVCADLCRDEVEAISTWSNVELARFHPAILSALRLVYPNKKAEWFKSKFLQSHKDTAEYWAQVLTRRAEIWDAAAARVAAVAVPAAAFRKPLRDRIRDKIKQRKEGKIASLKAKASAASKCKPTPKASGGAPSSSDSDTAPAFVVDLSKSPSVPTCTDQPAAAAPAPAKLAPSSDSYTKAEFKAFSKIAASIRDVDERQGFAPATINFIDTEFSDATGRLAKASKSRDPWKQKRVDMACAMAAKIMEDRCEPCHLLQPAFTPYTPHTGRVRLFKRGDAISNEARNRKLQREYNRMSQLTQHIFWTSVGREGAYHFEQELKHKKMAEHLRESVAGGISVEKAQKMIRRSIDVQKKSNMAKSAGGRSARSRSFRQPPRRVPFHGNRSRGRSTNSGRRSSSSSTRHQPRRSSAPQRVRRTTPRDRSTANDGSHPS